MLVFAQIELLLIEFDVIGFYAFLSICGTLIVPAYIYGARRFPARFFSPLCPIFIMHFEELCKEQGTVL